MHKFCKNLNQAGEVALFIVIFSAMLMIVVTVGFTRLMVADQQQASNSDLSQSAYDSALAGVEDAKRALARYETICSSGGGDCSGAKTIVASTDCNVAVKSLTDIAGRTEPNGEVKVMSDDNSSALNQSYTCVKIALDTSDYVGTLSQGDRKMIPLKGTDSFDSVQIEWFSANDLSKTDLSEVDLGNNDNALSLNTTWPSNRPSIMRTQLIQFAVGDSVNSLDNDSYTLFLYPKSTGSNSLDFVLDKKTEPKGEPQAIKCSSSLSSGGYACEAKIELPKPVDNTRLAFLYLTSIYNASSYKVSLYNNSTPVKFSGVQPVIDSTGRTNDLFRRVQTRVEMTNVNFPYPTSAVYTKGDLCKAFKITNSSSDYSELDCNP